MNFPSHPTYLKHIAYSFLWALNSEHQALVWYQVHLSATWIARVQKCIKLICIRKWFWKEEFERVWEKKILLTHGKKAIDRQMQQKGWKFRIDMHLTRIRLLEHHLKNEKKNGFIAKTNIKNTYQAKWCKYQAGMRIRACARAFSISEYLWFVAQTTASMIIHNVHRCNGAIYITLCNKIVDEMILPVFIARHKRTFFFSLSFARSMCAVVSIGCNWFQVETTWISISHQLLP